MKISKERLALEKQVHEIGIELERLQAENQRIKDLLNMREEEELKEDIKGDFEDIA